jgi:hypothetical protein
MRLLLTAVFLAAAWLLPISPASAQAPSSPVPGGGQTTNISDQKLDAAAAALKQVASVKENFEQRIGEAGPSEKERIADEGKNALVKAVTDQGLSVEEYSTILVVAQNDPAVYEKLLQRIRPSDK